MTAARTPSSPDTTAAPGLRERKKIKTRLAIRRATYALIAEQGYEATTVEQIAEAAEVSPSTVIRYFPAKEDIVLTDEHDSLLEAALRARPVDEPVLETVRHVVKGRLRAVLVDGTDADRQELLLRTRLMRDVPAVRARVTESLCTTGRLLCTVIAERTGRDAGDLKVRVFAAAVVATLLEATLYWTEHGRRDAPADLADPADLVDLIDDALDVLADRSWEAP